MGKSKPDCPHCGCKLTDSEEAYRYYSNQANQYPVDDLDGSHDHYTTVAKAVREGDWYCFQCDRGCNDDDLLCVVKGTQTDLVAFAGGDDYAN